MKITDKGNDPDRVFTLYGGPLDGHKIAESPTLKVGLKYLIGYFVFDNFAVSLTDPKSISDFASAFAYYRLDSKESWCLTFTGEIEISN